MRFTTLHPLKEVIDKSHADADVLQNVAPNPPLTFCTIQQDPVLVLFLEKLPDMLHLLLVTGVTNVENLRAVVHQMRPAMGK